MENRILGLHHITAIAGKARRNFKFYTEVLGLRMVKKTVNFDDPGTYHFYYGNEVGSPGTILTFFPWENIGQGKAGAGMATDIGYSVPKGSLDFWKERFQNHNVSLTASGHRFSDEILSLQDPDGLSLTLISSPDDNRTPWETPELNASTAIGDFIL